MKYDEEMKSILIQTKELSRSYLTEELETLAVQNVTLEIMKGEFVAVMGPSGCGKTSLLNLLGLIDQPSSGEYFFDGQRVNGLSENQSTRIRRGTMGFIFQNFNLVDELNVLENVGLPLVFMGVKRKERRARALEILERLKISHPDSPPRAMVLYDSAKPGDSRVFKRGNAGSPGEVAPRRFL